MHSRVQIEPDGGADLISLADLKAELGIGDTSEDVLLQSRITRISKLFAEACDRSFASGSAVETFTFDRGEESRRGQALWLALYPVDEIEDVVMSGVTVDEESYELDAAEGRLWLVDGAWSGTVVVSYSGGYELPTAAPALLQQALIDELSDRRDWSASERDPSLRSREIAHADSRINESFFAEPTKAGGLSAGVLEQIKPFKRRTIA